MGLDSATVSQPLRARPRPALLAARTWRELAFHLASPAVTITGLGWLVVLVLTAPVLLATRIGSHTAARLLLRCRSVGGWTRSLCGRLLDREIAAPPAPEPSMDGRRVFQNAATWRALTYLALGPVISLAAVTASTGVLALGAGAATSPLWAGYLPAVRGSDGAVRHGVQLFGAVLDAPWQQTALTLAGALVLAVWPRVNRGAANLHLAVVESLLGTTDAERRLLAVTRARDFAVLDAASTLRRIERQLHDGTQGRLTGMTMQLADTLARVRTGADTHALEPRLEQILASVRAAAVELRTIIQGIHPPVLDNGVEFALRSALPRSPLPVTLDVQLPERLSAALESLIYYGVLEMLTNASKHAAATSASVTLRLSNDRRTVIAEIGDDGVGGAHVQINDPGAPGSGLAGLLDRVRTFDGELEITSPPGGPTLIRLLLPVKPSS